MEQFSLLRASTKVELKKKKNNLKDFYPLPIETKKFLTARHAALAPTFKENTLINGIIFMYKTLEWLSVWENTIVKIAVSELPCWVSRLISPSVAKP